MLLLEEALPHHDPVHDRHDDDVVYDGGGGVVPLARGEVVGEEDEGQQPGNHEAQGVQEVQRGAELEGAHGLALLPPVVGGEGVGDAEDGEEDGDELDALRVGEVGQLDGQEHADVEQGGDQRREEEVQLEKRLERRLGAYL